MRYRFRVEGKELTEAQALEALKQNGILEVAHKCKDGSYDTVHIREYRAALNGHVLYVLLYDWEIAKPGGLVSVAASPSQAIRKAKEMARELEQYAKAEEVCL